MNQSLMIISSVYVHVALLIIYEDLVVFFSVLYSPDLLGKTLKEATM